MNRRALTLYYWLTRRNSVGFREMLRFLGKPNVRRVAARYIAGIDETNGDLQVQLKGLADCLYWPKAYARELLYQVVAESMDPGDWHRYLHPLTPVTADDVVIDVGAAEGLFSLLALQRGARVVAIEPSPVFAASLQRTFRRHVPGQMTIHALAAGDREARVSLSPEPLRAAVQMDSGSGSVPMVPLDRLLGDLDRVTFIKADIEGLELPMLRGASTIIRRFRPKLALTCYHEENDHREMIRLLQKLVPDYRFALAGITHFQGKPLLLRCWVPDKDDKRFAEPGAEG
ncbi:MAG: FkbM family methyltransferase [Acidobacteria bacterium]|jgi:FkbM family methyltransferase|nr:FkbM family methyltransferase [Acidobacteriota bacterium]